MKKFYNNVILKSKTSLMDKILILLGAFLISILLIENMVQPIAYLFIWSSSTWQLSLVSAIIGTGIGYGLKGFLGKKNGDDENYDF